MARRHQEGVTLAEAMDINAGMTDVPAKYREVGRSMVLQIWRTPRYQLPENQWLAIIETRDALHLSCLAGMN